MTMKNGVASIDLTEAYPGKITKFVRTVELSPQNTVTVRDEIEAPHPVEALWGMVTDAQVTVDPNHAKLEKGNAALQAEIVSPKGAVFETVSTTPPLEQEHPNNGTQKLVVRLKGKVSRPRIAVGRRSELPL